MNYISIPYDIYKYPFLKLIQELLGTNDLQSVDEKHEGLFQVGNDSKTSFHDLFYSKYRSGWEEMEKVYNDFIEDEIAASVREDFLVQKFPTFRVHLNSNVAVGAFHKDADFNHPKGEINFVIPLTNSNDTASIWVESEPDKGDFEPMIMKVGEYIQFNGNELTHGNKVNDTGLTRVSMDFRILPLSMYHPEQNSESVTRKTKFVEGEYYKLFKK